MTLVSLHSLNILSHGRMATFLASVMIMCFWDVAGYANLTKRLIYGCTWLFICLLILWTIVTGWETTRHTVLFASPRRFFAKLFGRGSAKNECKNEPGEDEDGEDARSVKSVRAARAVTAVETAYAKSWRNRLRKMAEKPRRLTRSMTMDTVFFGRKGSRSSTLTPAYSPPVKVEKESHQPC